MNWLDVAGSGGGLILGKVKNLPGVTEEKY
jgi:hypothetical protein